MNRVLNFLSFEWLYPENITRQEVYNRFIIFVLAVLIVCVGCLTVAFMVQKQHTDLHEQEALDRRAKADAHSQQWKKAMEDYQNAIRGKDDKEGRKRTGPNGSGQH